MKYAHSKSLVKWSTKTHAAQQWQQRQRNEIDFVCVQFFYPPNIFRINKNKYEMSEEREKVKCNNNNNNDMTAITRWVLDLSGYKWKRSLAVKIERVKKKKNKSNNMMEIKNDRINSRRIECSTPINK